MEVVMALKSGMLLRAPKRAFAQRGRDYYEVSQVTQKKSRPSPGNCVVFSLSKIVLSHSK
jgi:hypothetical protein